MKIDSFDKFIALSKENADALVKSGTLAVKGLEDVAKVSHDYFAAARDKADAALKALLACKTPVEALELQGKLVRESVEGAIAEGRKIVELTQSNLTASLEPIGARVAAFQSLIKPAA